MKIKIIELITKDQIRYFISWIRILGQKNILFLSIAPQKVVFADANSKEKQLSNNINQTDLENDPLLVEGIKIRNRFYFHGFCKFAFLLRDLNLKIMPYC